MTRNLGKFGNEALNKRIYETFFTFATIPSLFDSDTNLKEINDWHNDLLINMKFPNNTVCIKADYM